MRTLGSALVAGVLVGGGLIAAAAATAGAAAPGSVGSPASRAPVARFVPGSRGDAGARPDDERTGSPPLTDHGGPIMRTERSYAIFWDPRHLQSGAPTAGITHTYKHVVARYFTDVAGSRFFAIIHQYAAQGQRPTKTRYAQTWVDRTRFPTNHCTNQDTGTNCVTDADIQARIVADAAAHGISSSMSAMFFVFTPENEGSCIDAACHYSAYEYYCAYHSHIQAGDGRLIYATIPFPTVSTGKNCYAPPGGRQQFPNDVNADAAVNVTSHEQFEAITDPFVTAWYDAARYEVGDECAWDFGPTLPDGGDVTLNGHPYGVQKEASNAAQDCVLSAP